MYHGKLKLIKSDLLEPPISEDRMHDVCCLICSDIATRPVICSVCKSIFCQSCACQWKSDHNSCPKKCHSPWKFNPIESIGVTLRCPFSDKCEKFKPEQLQSHLKACTFKSKELADAYQMRKNFLCANGHLLEFWSGLGGEQYVQYMLKCSQCEQKMNCRATCRKCGLNYCVICRPPICSRNQCPNNHRFFKTTVQTEYWCDSCGLMPKLFDQDVYDCSKCNFGVCESCHKRLPQNVQVKSLDNNYQKCFDGSFLNYIEPQEGICNLCEKQSQLERLCPKCNKKYCLICKPITLRASTRCQRNHLYSYIESDLKKCKKCKKERTVFWSDPECGFILCKVCVSYLKTNSLNFQRPINSLCVYGHQLYTIGQNPIKSECSKCHKERLCIFTCFCDQTIYCIECFPSGFPGCDPFAHPYTKQTEKELICTTCEKQSKGCLTCEECHINVCKQCSGQKQSVGEQQKIPKLQQQLDIIQNKVQAKEKKEEIQKND